MDQGYGDDDQLPSATPGTMIAAKYRLEGMIGRGGMGSVWSATHLGLGQRVAVKLIARRYANSKEARQRFDLEAKAAAQLRSRFVVQVYDNGETEDGTPYIVMELLDGESLDHRVQRGALPVDQTVRILSQAARAVSRAHALGIVHRDIKPENIFLTRTDDDEGEIAKVLDFGIAKIKPPEGADSATRTGAVLGTPLFMSPEQARGLKSVDHRTDVYSLGMVAYMMLTGQPAFSGESFGDLLVAICTQPLPSMRQTAPWLPPALDHWLSRACAREPTDRYQSVEEMMEGLFVASGIARSTTKAQEIVRSDSAGTGRIPPIAPTTTDATQAGIGIPVQRTTGPLSVTGDDIPKRSLALPIVLALAVAGALGAGAFVFLRSSSNDASTATTASAAVLAAPAPSNAASGSEPPPAASTVAPAASAESAARPAVPGAQKGVLPVKPSGKVHDDGAKGAAKAPPAPPAKSKSVPDLGF